MSTRGIGEWHGLSFVYGRYTLRAGVYIRSNLCPKGHRKRVHRVKFQGKRVWHQYCKVCHDITQQKAREKYRRTH